MLGYAMALAAIFSIFWASKSKNRVTKFASIALGASILLRYLAFGGVNGYAPYVFAFFSLFAGFEPIGSFKFKNKHKAVFLYCSIVSFIFLIQGIIQIPMKFPLELLMLPIPIFSIWMWRLEKKVIYQRLGYLVVWSTQAVLALYFSKWLRAGLAEFL